MHVMKLLAVLCLLLFTTGCSSAQPTQGGGTEPTSTVKQAVCSRLWTSVSAGYDHTCATTDDGRLYCWGRNDKGQAGGIPDWENVLTPYVVFNGIIGGSGVVVDKVVTQGNHSCALVSAYPPSSYSRNLWCWGDDTDEAVGDPNHNPVWAPYHVVTGIVTPVNDVAIGLGSTCIVDGNDDLRCWGKRDYCQTGTQSGTPTNTPTLAPTMYQGDTWPNNARGVKVQDGTVCGVGLDDTARCWGNNAYRILGNNSSVSYSCTPVSPGISFDYVGTLTLGWGMACYTDLNNDNLPECVGMNYVGELGRGYRTTTSPYYVGTFGPLDDYYIDPSTFITQIEGGFGYNAAALDYDGYVYAWGNGYWGANGDGSTDIQTRPELVMPGGWPIVATQISAGSDFDCALKPDGTAILCWGLNNHGQLGDGTTTNRTTPVSIPCP